MPVDEMWAKVIIGICIALFVLIESLPKTVWRRCKDNEAMMLMLERDVRWLRSDVLQSCPFAEIHRYCAIVACRRLNLEEHDERD